MVFKGLHNLVKLFILEFRHLWGGVKRFYLFIFRGEREKERERNINVWLPLVHPTLGTPAYNPGMCPDWDSSQRPFGSQVVTQSTESHYSGLSSDVC